MEVRDGLTGKEAAQCECNDSGGWWGVLARGQRPPHSHDNMADRAITALSTTCSAMALITQTHKYRHTHKTHTYESIWVMVRSTNMAERAAPECLLLPGACARLLIMILTAFKYYLIFRKKNMLCSWHSNTMSRQLVNDLNIWPLTCCLEAGHNPYKSNATTVQEATML